MTDPDITAQTVYTDDMKPEDAKDWFARAAQELRSQGCIVTRAVIEDGVLRVDGWKLK